MIKNFFLLILAFYILTLLQTSFLVHFNAFGIIPNFTLIAVIFINLFSPSQWQKVFSAIVGGFYLDVFSLNNPGGFFGFYTLILLGLFLFLKIISEKYVRFPVVKKI